MEKPYSISSEKLAYWYFRLNGFLTIPNFIVHPDWGSDQRTDVDILGVRFPYRKELLEDPMKDDEIFTKIKTKPFIVIAEVKKQTCKLNGPWTEPEAKNMNRVLRAIGSFEDNILGQVAQNLYVRGSYENETYFVSLCCIGIRRNPYLPYKNVPQIIWTDILRFIYRRFKDYRKQKSSHSQWPITGKKLFRLVSKCSNESEFIKSINIK